MSSMMDFGSISQKTGSPAYLFDEGLFKERAYKVRSAFGEKVDLCFSVKANPFLLPFVDDTFKRIEVCSPGELRICEAIGADLSKVLFSGVNKTEDEVARALDDGVDILTIESMRHLEMICRQADRRGICVPVLLRTADESQFGMDAGDVKDIIARRQEYPGISIRGLHYFTGTQKMKTAQIEKELAYMSELIDEIRDELGFTVEELEYGTGLAVDYFRDDADDTELKRLADIAPAIRQMGEKVHLTVEMGRFFAAPCGLYFTGIVDTKVNGGIHYAICDGGIHQMKYDGQIKGMKIPKISVISAEHPTVSGSAGEWTICGSLCTTEDVLVRDADLPALKAGDILIFHRTGAYSAMEGMSTFLSRDMPAVWLRREDGSLRQVRQRIDTWEMNTPGLRGADVL